MPDESERPVRVREHDRRTPATTTPKRICRTRLKVPGRTPIEGDTIFTCSLKVHDLPGLDGAHKEFGRVRLKDGRIMRYVMEWREETPEVWRVDGNANA